MTDDNTQSSAIKRALLAVKTMREKLEAAERSRTEPIAVIGTGCRFPGGASSPEAFWRLLAEGRDGTAEMPHERWDIDAFYDPDRAAPGKIVTRRAACIDQVDGFDPSFFNISPREAKGMDPQQRLALEVTWEALEDAGLALPALEGSCAGVFMGVMHHDYSLLQSEDLSSLDAYASTGTHLSIIANRISFTFDFHGPSLALDTACSSSLVAVHAAVGSLRRGECDLALAGGVNLLLSPMFSISYSKWGMLSPDGRCYTFDARANGFVRGEGCGVVILKRLSDAIANGDPIRAVVRGTATNQDGKTNVMTAPSGLAQQRVIREALADGKVDPALVSYVETHGTGTPLGDPIEVEALASVYGSSAAHPCLLGAVKTNIGHLEGAAGIAGFIKAVLCLERGAIPPNLNFATANPHLPLRGTRLELATELRPWRPHEQRRLAAVSSFGAGGTNAHVVLEEAPAASAPAEAADREQLLLLSAKTPEALAALAKAYRSFLTQEDRGTLQDIAYTASLRRSHHEHRLSLVARSREELAASLGAFLLGETHPGLVRGQATPGARPKVVFVFPGQGSQWVGMGRELLEQEPIFRAAINACDQAIQREAGWSLLEELRVDEGSSQLDRIDVVQPVLFAMEVALAALWRSWGVEPDAVVGHSMGEIAGGHVAGALSLEDAVRIICRRSRLLKRVSGRGAMAVVELPLEQAREALRGHEDLVSVAVSNGPRSTVLSGEPGALGDILAKLGSEGVFCRWVKVDVASHSPQMEPLLGELREALGEIRPVAARVEVRSTVTGGVCSGPELGPAYWAKNLREPVLFAPVIERLLEDGASVFVEISPHPILTMAMEEVVRESGQQGVALGSLRRGKEERRALLESLGELYARGYPADFRKLYPQGGRCVSLPAYPWQRQRYWLEGSPRAVQALGERKVEEPPRDELDGCVFAAEWWRQEHLAEPTLRSPAGQHSWLVLCDQGTTSASLVAGLLARGDTCVRVMAGEAYACVEPGVYQIDPSNPADYRRLLGDAFGGGSACYGALHLWNLDASPASRTTLETLDQEILRGSVSAVYLAQALVRQGWRDTPRLWLITRGAQAVKAGTEPVAVAQAPLWGLGRTIALEHPELRCTRVDLGPTHGDEDVVWLLRELRPTDREDQVALREDGRYVARLVRSRFGAPGAPERLEPTNGRLFRLDVAEPGGLDRLSLQEARRAAPGPGEVEIEVEAAGLHWLDLHLALGASFDEAATASGQAPQLGMECAGRIVAVGEGIEDLHEGQDVIALGFGALSARLTTKRELVVPKSARLRWEQAATLPLAFLTACHALDRIARLRAGERVLIHDGAGGTGMAAIQWARRAGAEIFATASGEEACAQLRSLGATHVLDARSPRFAEEIRRATNGEGVDVALGSLSSKFAVTALGLLRDDGRLIEIGERDMAPDKTLDLEPFSRGLSFSRLDLPGMIRRRPSLVGALLAEVTSLVEAGVLQPLPVQSFPISCASEAFRHLNQGRHAEKIVVTMRDPAARIDVRAKRSGMRPDGSYLITGGLGGLGLVVARWMVEQGARDIALAGRHEPGEAAREAIMAMEKAGARVLVVQADISKKRDGVALLSAIEQRLAPLRGVVHAAGVLEDRTMLELSEGHLRRAAAPKILGAWNLHELTRDLPLDFFVMYSSVGSLLGSPGQGNYTAANAFLDALAHARCREGLPAMSIQWGNFSRVGLAAASENRGERLSFRGMDPLTPEQGNLALGRLLDAPRAEIGVVRFEARRWLEFYPAAATLPFFAQVQKEPDNQSPVSADAGRMRKTLEAAAPAERQSLLEGHVAGHLGRVLHLDPSRIDRLAPFSSLGVDSLMSLEVRNRLEVSLGLKLPPTLMFMYPHVASLSAHLMGSLGFLAVPSVRSRPLLETKGTPLSPTEDLELESLGKDDLLALLEQSFFRAEQEV